jgi:hypothetical protein
MELITSHRTINYHETRKEGQGPVWAVAPLIITYDEEHHNLTDVITGSLYQIA